MRHAWLTLLVAAFFAVPAFGQEREAFGPAPGMWELQLSGSGSSNEDVDAGSFGASAELSNYLTREFSVGVRQSVDYTDFNAGTAWNGSTRVVADFHFDLNRLRPFIGASLGYVYGDSISDTWAAGPEAGLKWYADQNTFIFGRVEYQFFFEDSDEIDDAFDDGQFVYTLGIGLNF